MTDKDMKSSRSDSLSHYNCFELGIRFANSLTLFDNSARELFKTVSSIGFPAELIEELKSVISPKWGCPARDVMPDVMKVIRGYMDSKLETGK